MVSMVPVVSIMVFYVYFGCVGCDVQAGSQGSERKWR